MGITSLPKKIQDQLTYSYPKFKAKKANKYGAVRSNGFGSKLESAVYQNLLLREKAKEISSIKQQHGVDLGFGISWKVDFSYFDLISWQRIWVEAKGVKTERYRMCLKLWEGGQGPGPLEIWEGSYKQPKLIKIVIPKTEKQNE
jgi:hypothetical protein